MFKPRIKIVGYRSEEKITEREGQEEIIKQNHFVANGDISITHINYVAHKNFTLFLLKLPSSLDIMA
ncbi:unnamed protein product [Acanthoscelides obtectus]|uniref:Uncharacterized protein n=1 Tax=Acanthoscelides obtectus TaxID=200917 RepID=A0A9P0PK82_ACAOB|nr:unnamed protein product [Acanthoscelides obtectus]CAK1671767.1 hypothetical protein AOBTE_LOCUS28449 [Acanthoscelides obtectus]